MGQLLAMSDWRSIVERMFDQEPIADLPASLAAAVAAVRDGCAAIASYDLTTVAGDQLLELTRALEVQRRANTSIDHRLIAEMQDRGLAGDVGAANTAGLLRGLLRVSGAEARRRVRAAADMGPRRTLTGEASGPLFPRVAAAQAAGVISGEHAAVITSAVGKLPDVIAAEYEAEVEATLVAHAANFDPVELGKIGRRLLDVLDPDGELTDDTDHDRRRFLDFSSLADGSGVGRFRLTPECAAIWQAIFDSMARPVPGADGASDARTASQRRHDAFRDAGLMILRGGELSTVNGVPVTVLITMTEQQFRTGQGYARTGFGTLIPTCRVLDLDCEAQTVGVVVNSTGGVMSYGRTRRLVSPSMRLALIARDQGCTFPGCDRPATWCEAHHFREWADSGPTDLDNLGLVCGYHHGQFERLGWRGVMIDGVPHWVPPAYRDPTRTPRRNQLHTPSLIPQN
jgi:Domain of unknown function (DUF222)